MDSLIVYPENKTQLKAIKAVMKAMNITFEQKNDVYPAYVVQGVKESLHQAENGQLTPYTGIKDMIESV